MGRVQLFDTTAAVASARDVFWIKGYSAASLPDLEAATGIGRSSLYHAFTNKRGLFDAAVQNYLDTVIRPRLRVLTEPDGIDKYFERLESAVATHRGCLLVNAATESDAHDNRAVAAVREYRRELTDHIAGAMRQQCPHWEASTIERRANVLTAMSISANVLSRIDVGDAAATARAARAQYAEWLNDSGL